MITPESLLANPLSRKKINDIFKSLSPLSTLDYIFQIERQYMCILC